MEEWIAPQMVVFWMLYSRYSTTFIESWWLYSRYKYIKGTWVLERWNLMKLSRLECTQPESGIAELLPNTQSLYTLSVTFRPFQPFYRLKHQYFPHPDYFLHYYVLQRWTKLHLLLRLWDLWPFLSHFGFFCGKATLLAKRAKQTKQTSSRSTTSRRNRYNNKR